METRLSLSRLLKQIFHGQGQDALCVRLSICGLAGALLLGLMPIAAQAASYDLKTESPSDTKIVVDSDLPWLAQDKGEFVAGWKNSYDHHISKAKWVGASSVLAINVYALSGLKRWGPTAGRIRESDFRAGYGDDMTAFAKIGCPVGSCARFNLSGLKCFSAVYFTAPPGSRTQSDKGKDLVDVTYCSVDLTLPDDLESLLSSIKIKKSN